MGGISHQNWVVYYCYTHITLKVASELRKMGTRNWAVWRLLHLSVDDGHAPFWCQNCQPPASNLQLQVKQFNQKARQAVFKTPAGWWIVSVEVIDQESMVHFNIRFQIYTYLGLYGTMPYKQCVLFWVNKRILGSWDESKIRIPSTILRPFSRCPPASARTSRSRTPPWPWLIMVHPGGWMDPGVVHWGKVYLEMMLQYVCEILWMSWNVLSKSGYVSNSGPN